MKLINLLAFTWFSISTFPCFSQSSIYGIDPRGGNGCGHIFKYSTTDNTFDIAYNFQNNLGSIGNEDEFYAHQNGKLYAFVKLPCAIGIASYSTSTKEYTVLNQTDYYADYVFGKPSIGPNGSLYGIGGLQSDATLSIFSYNVQTNRLDTAAFFKPDHGHPVSGLTLASDGKFYLLTDSAICRFDPNKSVNDAISVLKYSNYFPPNDLIEPENGVLYGNTNTGVFSYNFIQDSFSIQASVPGANPGGLIKSSYDGMLYGLCKDISNFPGQLYQFNPQTKQVSIIHTFGSGSTDNPAGKLVQAGDKLFGTTIYGTNGLGSIFSYNMNTSDFQNAFEFTDSNEGKFPIGTLTLHNNGKLYGATFSGGNGHGVIFEFDPNLSTYNAPIKFNTDSYYYPSYKPMVLSSDGLLYGMSTGYGTGYLFSFDPASSTYRKRSNLPVNNTFYNLTETTNGTLYLSAIENGNTQNESLILKYLPQTDSLSVVYQSTDFPKMTYMIQGNDSQLYGYCQTDDFGGLSLCKYSPGTNSITNIQLLGDHHRPNPLKKDAKGRIIGIPQNQYGSGGTSLFSYDPGTSTFNYLHSFPYNETTNYGTDFCIGNDQKVYGIRRDPQLNWLVFSYDLLENTYNPNIELNFQTGQSPNGQLIMGMDDLLYGTKSEFISPKIKGSLFSLDPGSEQYERIHHTGASCNSSGSGLVEVRNSNAYTNCEGNHCWYLFPNPSSDVITLNLLQGELPNTLQIYNAIGQLVFETDQLKNYQKISVDHLKSGVYLVRMNFSDTSVTTNLLKY